MAVTGGPPWPRTDRRTNGLARVDLKNYVCVRVCVGSLFFFASAASDVILFFFFFFSFFSLVI